MRTKLLFFIFLFLSCSNSETTFTIDKETFISIIMDVEIAEVAGSVIYGEVKDSVMTVYLDQIAERNGVSPQDIIDNLYKLHENPIYMAELYQEAEKRLIELKNKRESMDAKK